MKVISDWGNLSQATRRVTTTHRNRGITHKPLSSFEIVDFVDGHKKRATCTVAREVNFGSAVVSSSTFWTERLAIETTTSMDIPVRNYLVHVW